MAERFFIVAQSFSAESFILAMRPIASRWNVFTENLFYGDVLYSDDKSLNPDSSEDFEDEDSGCVWIGLKDISKHDRKPLGGTDDRKFQQNIDKAFARLGTSNCTFLSFEYNGSTVRSQAISEEISGYLFNHYKIEEFYH